MITTKSTDPNCFIRLFDKSKRSSEISGAKAFHGTDIKALLGKPGSKLFVKQYSRCGLYDYLLPKACSGFFKPRNIDRWTLFISPDDMTRPCNEIFSKTLVSLRNVTFFSVQSSNDTEYMECRSPSAIFYNFKNIFRKYIEIRSCANYILPPDYECLRCIWAYVAYRIHILNFDFGLY